MSYRHQLCNEDTYNGERYTNLVIYTDSIDVKQL